MENQNKKEYSDTWRTIFVLKLDHLVLFVCTFFVCYFVQSQKVDLFMAIKVARPGFSLIIPPLFEHEIQRCLKRNSNRV